MGLHVESRRSTAAGSGMALTSRKCSPRRGAELAVADINPAAAAGTIKRITMPAIGPRIFEHDIDGYWEVAVRMVDSVENRMQEIDILVNNAGVTMEPFHRNNGGRLGPVLDINLKGQLLRARSRTRNGSGAAAGGSSNLGSVT